MGSPVFRALDPDKINTIASTIVTVFQGQGGTINDILDQTAQLTAHIADRDAAIGEVVKNLNVVLTPRSGTARRSTRPSTTSTSWSRD